MPLTLRAAPTIVRGEGDAPPPGDTFLIGLTEAEILALPMTGAGWDNVVTQSDKTITPNMAIGNIGGKQASQAVCAGLRYVRTGTESYKTKVVDACEALRLTDLGTTDYQTWIRQTAGWVIAADLVGHRTQAWIDFLSDLRYQTITAHPWGGIWIAAHRSANNHGALARAALLAINLFISDQSSTAPDGNPAGVAQDLKFIKGYLGDTTQYGTVASTSSSPPFGRYGVGAGWTDYVSTWTHDPVQDVWTCINPTGISSSKEGLMPAEAFRDNTAYSVDGNGRPIMGSSGQQYHYTAGPGVAASAILLAGAGHTDVWEWSSQAVRRWREALERWSYTPPAALAGFIDPLLNHIYGTAYTAVDTDSYSIAGVSWLTQNAGWLKP